MSIEEVIANATYRKHESSVVIQFEYEHDELVDITIDGKWIFEPVMKTQSMMGADMKNAQDNARKYMKNIEYYSKKPIRFGANYQNKPQRSPSLIAKAID